MKMQSIYIFSSHIKQVHEYMFYFQFCFGASLGEAKASFLGFTYHPRIW